MKKFALLFIIGLSQATVFDRSLDQIPRDDMNYLFSTGQAFGNPCDQVSLNAAQANFNTMLGLSDSYTWRNSSYLSTQVRQIFSNGSITAFQTVCRARDGFESYLRVGGYYESCLSRYFLMNQPGADWYTVMTYIHLYQHLDFICNQGFEQFAQVSTWACMQFFIPAAGNVACDTAFNTSMSNGGYQNLCVNVLAYMSCKKTFWDTSCYAPIGYYACEEVRVGYAFDCRTLRCPI